MNGYGMSPLELMAADAMLRGEIYCESFDFTAAWVTGTASALGANGTTDVQLIVPGDSDFVLQHINGVAMTAAGTFLAIPDYLLSILITGAGRQIQNIATAFANICGAYQNDRVPGAMPMPRLIQSNSQLTLTLANRTGTAANLVHITLRGFKIFYQSSNRQTIFHVL